MNDFVIIFSATNFPGQLLFLQRCVLCTITADIKVAAAAMKIFNRRGEVYFKIEKIIIVASNETMSQISFYSLSFPVRDAEIARNSCLRPELDMSFIFFISVSLEPPAFSLSISFAAFLSTFDTG